MLTSEGGGKLFRRPQIWHKRFWWLGERRRSSQQWGLRRRWGLGTRRMVMLPWPGPYVWVREWPSSTALGWASPLSSFTTALWAGCSSGLPLNRWRTAAPEAGAYPKSHSGRGVFPLHSDFWRVIFKNCLTWTKRESLRDTSVFKVGSLQPEGRGHPGGRTQEEGKTRRQIEGYQSSWLWPSRDHLSRRLCVHIMSKKSPYTQLQLPLWLMATTFPSITQLQPHLPLPLPVYLDARDILKALSLVKNMLTIHSLCCWWLLLLIFKCKYYFSLEKKCSF